MAIKHVKTLATLQDVVNYSFRNCAEIEECVAKLGADTRAQAAGLRYAGRTMQTAAVVRTDLIQKNYQIADDLQQRIDMLDNLHMQLKYSFAGAAGQAQAIQTLMAMREGIDRRLDQAYDYLEQFAEANAPEALKQMVNQVTEEVLSRLRNQPRVTRFAMVSIMPQTDEPIYTFYVRMEQFKDDSGFVHPEYYLVYTGHFEAAEGESDYYVTSLNTFVVPGRFKWGTQFVDVASGVQQTADLLDSDNFSDLSRRLPLPVSRVNSGDLQQARRWVSDVTVVDNEIKVKLAVGVGKDKVSTVVQKLTDDIAGVLSGHITGRLRYRTRWVGRQYSVTYTLVTPEYSPKRLITVEQMEGLKGLGFDDLDIGRLHQALNNRR